MLEPGRDISGSDRPGHDWLLTLHPEDRGGDDWMISYMDIMTLLVALFVLLLSLGNPAGLVRDALANTVAPSTPSQPVARVSAEAVAAARRIGRPGIVLPAALQAAIGVASHHKSREPQLNEVALVAARRLGKSLRVMPQAVAAAREVVNATVVSDAAQAAAIRVAGEWRLHQPQEPLPVIDGVEVSRVKGGINLRIQDHLLFDSGEAALTGAGQKVTQRLVEILQSYPGTISVEGHTDSVPIDTPRFPSNWELSSGRATAILRYLIEAGIDASRLRAVGYADTRPLESNDTADGRAANRRVEVIIHDSGAA